MKQCVVSILMGWGVAIGAQAAELSYQYAEVQFVQTDLEVDGIDSDFSEGGGWGIATSWNISPNIYFGVGLVHYIDAFDLVDGLDTSYTLLGYHWTTRPERDAFVELMYERYEFDGGAFSGNSDSAEGGSVRAGMRQLHGDRWETSAWLRYQHVSELGDNAFAGGSVRHYFGGGGWSLGLSGEVGSDTYLNLSLRTNY